MNLAATLVFLLALAAPTDRPAPAAKPDVAISMVAVEATNEAQQNFREADTGKEKHFGPGLDVATCNALKVFPYTSFRRIADATAKSKFNEAARLSINETYTLCVEPLSKDPTGLIRAKVWIEERREGAGEKEPIRKALSTTVKAVSGDKLILGGLKLKKGDLVVALTLKG